MASGSIDYDQLAAALLRAGFGRSLTAGTGEVERKTSDAVSASDAAAVSRQVVDVNVNKGGLSTGPDRGKELSLESVSGVTVLGNADDGVDTEAPLAREVTVTSDWSGLVEDELKAAERSGGRSAASTGSTSGESVTFKAKRSGYSEGVTKLRLGQTNEVAAIASSTGGYYARVVRNDRAVRLRKLLEQNIGCKIPKSAQEDLAITTFAAGVMPDAVADGKKRLRMLATVGDAALTLQLAIRQMALGSTVESAQSIRSRLTSNKSLIDVMVRTQIVDFVLYPSGVDPGSTVATATAFEAILGVLTLTVADEFVRKFLEFCGIF